MPQGTPHPTVIPFLKVYIALTAPERTDSQSMLQGGTQTHSLCYKEEAQTHSLCYKEAIRNGISIKQHRKTVYAQRGSHLTYKRPTYATILFFPCQFRVFFRVLEGFTDLKEESYLNRPRALN